MKVCPFCSKEIEDQDTICPYCGRDLAAAAKQAAAQLGAVGYPVIKSILWILGYVLLTSVLRVLILYFTAPALGFWSVILCGVVTLSIIAYGAWRAQQQKRSALKSCLLVYGGYTILWTWLVTSVALSE